MSEWRTLPEFPKYEITSDGDVRNKWTKKKLKEIENKRTGAWHYSLRKEDGRSTCRNFWGLVYSAYPELEPAQPVEEPKVVHRIYARRGKYVEIPGYPKYEIHPDGKVRYSKTRRPRPTEQINGVEYVALFNDDGSVKRRVSDVLAALFPMKEAA
jgi:hypothetical protein